MDVPYPDKINFHKMLNHATFFNSNCHFGISPVKNSIGDYSYILKRGRLFVKGDKTISNNHKINKIN